MKNVVKNNVEKCKKMFTNEERNIIINEDCNPLSKDYNKFYERGGLFMIKTKDIVSKEQMNRLIISKEDFKEIFNSKKVISRGKYEEYLKIKNCT